jgi:hypothetical protein
MFPIIKSHLEIQDEIAEKLTAKAKKYNKAIDFCRCPDCGEVYKLASNLILCGYCGYVRDDYEKQPDGSIVKKKNETKSRN